MTNVRKRILQLTPLPSASLDTTIVGVDNGTTYRIELDVLADAVTSRVNILDRDRLNSLESVTSSFETKGRSVISSSAQITALGFVSSSTDISSLNSFTSSQNTLNTAFTNGINTRLQTSTFNQYTASISTASLVDRLNVIENVSSSWITESETGSFLTSLNGAISSSAQLTSSYDTRYVLSGSITQTTWDNIENKPSGIVSQSTDLSSLNQFTESIDARVDSLENATASYLTSLNGTISSSQQIADLGFVTGSFTTINTFNSLTQSFNSISQSFTTISSSVGSVDFNGLISGSSQLTASYDLRYTLSGSVSNVPSGTISGSSQLTSSFIQSSQTSSMTAGFSTYASNVAVVTTGTTTDSTLYPVFTLNSASNGYVGLRNHLSGSYYFDGVTRKLYAETFVGSIEATNGVISGSSQLTSSYDSRYALSGSIPTSFSQSVDSRLDVVEASASLFLPFSQSVDSRLDNQEAFSSSLSVLANSSTKILDSAPYTSATAWSGSYIGRGGVVKVEANFTLYSVGGGAFKTFTLFRNGVAVDSGSFFFNTTNVHHTMPTLYYIGANETGTNTYSVGHDATADNNDFCTIVVTETFNSLNGGLATTGSNTFTGNNTFRGTSRFETVGGDEGGEIEFGVPQTNTSLSTRVVQDVFQNRLRIFDGNTNGVFIDLSKAPTGVSGELMHKASGFVNRGVDVTLGNLKARMAATGNASLQLSTVSGTYSIYGSGTYSQAGAIAGATLSTTLSITTTPTYIVAGYNFGVAGAVDTWNIVDVNLGIAWRITMIVGFAYNNNFISIERLH